MITRLPSLSIVPVTWIDCFLFPFLDRTFKSVDVYLSTPGLQRHTLFDKCRLQFYSRLQFVAQFFLFFLLCLVCLWGINSVIVSIVFSFLCSIHRLLSYGMHCLFSSFNVFLKYWCDNLCNKMSPSVAYCRGHCLVYKLFISISQNFKAKHRSNIAVEATFRVYL